MARKAAAKPVEKAASTKTRKPRTPKAPKEERLEDILMACRNNLRGRADMTDKRDDLSFVNEAAGDAVNALSQIVTDKVSSLTDKLIELLQNLKEDGQEFKKLGITFEEKAFYDVLCEMRDKHEFEYADEKCLELAKKVKELVDNSAIYANWLDNDNLKAQLDSDLLILLYENGYPPEWSEEVYKRVLEQVQNFKTYHA